MFQLSFDELLDDVTNQLGEFGEEHLAKVANEVMLDSDFGDENEIVWDKNLGKFVLGLKADPISEKQAECLGNRIIQLFSLPYNQNAGRQQRVDTMDGDKTALGLGRTIFRAVMESLEKGS